MSRKYFFPEFLFLKIPLGTKTFLLLRRRYHFSKSSYLSEILCEIIRLFSQRPGEFFLEFLKIYRSIFPLLFSQPSLFKTRAFFFVRRNMNRLFSLRFSEPFLKHFGTRKWAVISDYHSFLFWRLISILNFRVSFLFPLLFRFCCEYI